MKILVTKPFDFDLGGNMTLSLTPSDEPVTVKQEAGEAAVAAGAAEAVEPGNKADKTAPDKK